MRRLQYEEKKTSLMFQVAGGHFRIGPASEEKVRPARPLDGAAGILVEDKPFAVFPPLNIAVPVDDRYGGLNEGEARHGKDAFIHGNGPACGQGLPEAAEGALLFFDFEKDIARVASEDVPRLFRMRFHIFPNGLHGHLLPGNF